MAELTFKVNIDEKGFAKVSKLNKDFLTLDKTARKSGKSVDKFTSSMKMLGPVLAGGALIKFGKDAIFAQSKLEDLELQFKPLLGSAEEAEARIKELSEFASKTPFELPQIAKASKTLETLTNGILSTGEGLKLVGDSASVAGVGFEELAVHVGRAFSNLTSNRAAGESLARMQELGLVSGQVRNEIEELQKAGEGTKAWEVLQDALKETEGAMEGLSGTFSGKLSTLADNWRLFTADFIEKSGVFDLAKFSVDALTESIGFLTNAKLEDEFDKIVASSELVSEALEEQRKETERLKQAELDKINAEAKAKADKIKNEKLFIEMQKEQSRINDKLLSDSEKFLAQLEKEDQKKREMAEKFVEDTFKFEEEQKQRLFELKNDQFEIERARIQEDYELRLEMAKTFNSDLEAVEEERRLRLAEVQEKEKAHTKQVEEAKRMQKLETAQAYAMSASNMVATMQEVFGKNKAFAIAEIVASGAQAQINALATQPFFPLGLSMSVLAGVQTAKALASVNSAKPYVTGGVIDGGRQLIEVNERGTSRPEAVLNSSATAQLGREGVDALNNGRIESLFRQSGGGDTFILNATGVVTEEVFDQFEAMKQERMDNR